MDPVCEEKITFLQKYIPFLANLIELLANDSEKEGKLAQMQLLYNLLSKPDNSVKIETLEKCEEVLCRVFGNADEKCNEAELSKTTHIKVEAENYVEQNEFDMPDEEEQTNGYTNTGDIEVSVTNSTESESVADNVSQILPEEGPQGVIAEELTNPEVEHNKTGYEATKNNKNSESSPEIDINFKANVKLSEIDNTEQDNISTKEPNKLGEINTSTDNESLLEIHSELEEQYSVTKEVQELNTNGNELLDQLDNEEEESLLEEMKTTVNSPTFETNINEAGNESDVFIQNPSETLPFKIISAESLATSSDKNLLEQIDPENEYDDLDIETAKDENNESVDPLVPTNNLQETSIPEATISNTINLGLEDSKKYNDEEDDDVLLIETRSSPICIDSDPEDEETAKRSCPITPKHTNTNIPKPPQKYKPSARKSTSIVKDSMRYANSHQTNSNKKTASHRKTKEPCDIGYVVKRDPKLLMETINLIDSDSEEDEQKTKNKSEKKDDDVIIVDSSSKQQKTTPTKTGLLSGTKQGKKPAPKPHLKHPPKPPTAQSNFLNAVNLQPTPETSPNPSTLSSQAPNKRSAISNASHNTSPFKRKLISASTAHPEPTSIETQPPSVSVSQVHDRILKEWLECFLKQFASPLQIASHACFVLLQRVLKYRFFQRLKVTRLVLNMRAKNSEPGKMDIQILLDLRNIFIQSDILTDAGRRFCKFATNDAFGKPVALTTDARTGKVTCRTRIVSNAVTPPEISKPPEREINSIQTSPVTSIQKVINKASSTTSSPATPVPSSSTSLGLNISSNKRIKKFRKLSDGGVVEGNDDNDYTPYMGELVLEDEVVSERKKSLRTNRTKRKEAGFTYSEDHDDEEFEALAKKIEDKKREELRLAEERELEKEREKERKVKKTVAKKTTSKRQTNIVAVEPGLTKEPIRKKLRLADAEILGTADDDDLLTPTWVEADGDDDGEVDSLLDFTEAPQTPENHIVETESFLIEDDADISQGAENFKTYSQSLDVGTNKLLKNTSRDHHTQCKKFDFCVHCLKRVPRIVHHYVNEHRSAEVFTSRLRTRNIRRLLTTSNVGFVHLYKGNQQQYAAHCIFCDKEVKFLLPYWFEHFTMHTGEYSFKCSGCNIRKPTRSLLANHLQSGSGCPKMGSVIRLHTFDTKSNQIEAHICTLCNYIQLHRKNVLRHLLTQHEIETVSPKHIIKVVLLQVSGPYRDEETIKNDESQLSLIQSSDDEMADINGASTSSLDGNSLMMQNDFTDNDDLSFMICGMLDVQTNLSATGNVLGNDDENTSVDNK